MFLQKIIFLIICFSLSGCSDYQTGYRDGYDGNKKQWIVFGKSEYKNGYQSGQAEKFQQDWVDENPAEIGLHHCPTYVFQGDPLLFLPSGYESITPDIYRIGE